MDGIRGQVKRKDLVTQFANFVNRATATYRSSLVKVIGISQRPNRDEMPAIKLENFLVKILGEVAPTMSHSLGGLPSNFLGRKDFIYGKFLYIGEDGTTVVLRTPYIGDSDSLKPKPRTLAFNRLQKDTQPTVVISQSERVVKNFNQ